ncbi:unnamed protein product [Paramecium sonneborni]|uniref:Uncharacterized protein n=1 Tax=Paramecium sonneborni TaxID=65129 RepID=A0A8S1MS01_9CILI|nr:unnamed protein product [Paramecium sonneborni]
MMGIHNQVLNFYTKNKRKIDPHLTILGLYLTTKYIVKKAKHILQTLMLTQVDIANKYGKGSYALITGGAGGIGKEFALDLAKKGFNLIIVDFNQVNLESIQQEILKINSDLMVKTILLDFGQGNNPEFFKRLQQEISDLDISILINNVGTAKGATGIFERIPLQNIIEGFNINFVTAIMLTHIVINQMNLRDKYQSLIINLGSASQNFFLPYYFGYGASKIGMASFFDALALENQINKKIDILTLKPYYVSTALINYRKGLFVISPEELVQQTWKYVGRVSEITPNISHQLQSYFDSSLPYYLLNYVNQLQRRPQKK